MKKQKWSVGFALCFLCALCLLITAGTVKGEGTGAATSATPTGYLENILFEKMTGKERVTIMASRQAGVQVEKLAGKSIAVKMDNMFVPTDFRKALGEGALNNVIRAVPEQSGTVGKQTVSVVIELRESVPYSVRQEGNLVIVDFNVAALPSATAVAAPAQVAGISTRPAQVMVSSAPPAPVSGGAPDGKQQASATAVTDKKAGASLAPGGCPPVEGQTNTCISVDLQDADIRGVLRLLAEQGKINIVAGQEVKGNVTVRMENVPWEQVLATVLEISGLTQKRTGDVISVMSTERAKKDDDERVARFKSRQTEEESKKAAENKDLLEKGKLKQLMIEAKILEVNESFLRELGVRWGAGMSTSVGGSDQEGNRNYSMGLLGGSAALATPLTKLTTGVALTRDSLAMSLGTTFVPTLGIILGGSNAVLNAQIGALQTNASGRVLSSPRVLTQDTQKAIIEQGEEIPVVTPGTSTNPPTTTYKQATLKLEVTPEIKPDNYILMTIKARNDRPNRAEKDINTGNMPVDTSSVDSKVVVRDGDTIVIGGILKTADDKTTSGVPWLSEIPILGWLFKYETITKTRRELLIFLTPRILKAEEAAHTRM
ncbi:MAG: secretin and TonB N-terminal domain-containing protein [Deltaproteobacteria bacterium]|nr:secretin and TonB N-terminal domain-containing protein [Deltaproteobacteria bacterium]